MRPARLRAHLCGVRLCPRPFQAVGGAVPASGAGHNYLCYHKSSACASSSRGLWVAALPSRVAQFAPSGRCPNPAPPRHPARPTASRAGCAPRSRWSRPPRWPFGLRVGFGESGLFPFFSASAPTAAVLPLVQILGGLFPPFALTANVHPPSQNLHNGQHVEKATGYIDTTTVRETIFFRLAHETTLAISYLRGGAPPAPLAGRGSPSTPAGGGCPPPAPPDLSFSCFDGSRLPLLITLQWAFYGLLRSLRLLGLFFFRIEIFPLQI